MMLKENNDKSREKRAEKGVKQVKKFTMEILQATGWFAD